MLAACRTGPPRPIEIDATDMCSRCRMAISQKRYAAELLDGAGNVWKFDDIGCMVRYTVDHHLNPQSGTYFVMDYGTQQWLAAPRAIYVRSAAIPSPMSGGLAAFQDQAQAEAFSRGVRGRVLAFEDLWTSPS
jgi:copper chaperone NosL